MELTSKLKERQSSSPLNSPTSCSTNNNNHNHNHNPNHNNPNPSPIPITRSDPNSPYPTTFVTADTSSFKQVVQMLTGSTEPIPSPKNQQQESTTTTCSSSTRNFVIPPIKTAPPKKQGFKLYERRNSIKNLISPLNHNLNSPRYKQPEILSPSLLDFPSLTLSPVTPLVEDPFNKSLNGKILPSSMSTMSSEEEEKAIAEKGYYLHPSPISTPRDSEPQLLPLFPLSSPRVSDNNN